MATSKRPSLATDYYNDFLYGKFKQNGPSERTALIRRMYQRILTELATNRFKWSGMPDEVDLRFLEMQLFYHALAVFYRDKRYNKFFALQGGGTNWINMLDNPVGFSVVGNNFVGMNVSAQQETENAGIAVPIWANYVRVPDLDIVNIYASKLAELDRTIEINSDNARMSKVVVSTENQRLSMTNLDRQFSEGNNSIKVAGPLQDQMAAIDLGVDPRTHEALHVLRTRIWNECMGLLGIENANQDKKERLVAGEVEANDDQTSSMRFVNLNARRFAAERINALYGLNVAVDYHSKVQQRADKVFEATMGAVDYNGNEGDTGE